MADCSLEIEQGINLLHERKEDMRRFSNILAVSLLTLAPVSLCNLEARGQSKCTAPLYQGYPSSCSNITIRWLNRDPVSTIDHFEIFRGGVKAGTAKGGALTFSEPAGCNFSASYVIKQIMKTGASCSTVTSGNPPHTKPCELCNPAPPSNGSITIVSAANYGRDLTPDSFGAAFPSGDIANVTAAAPPGAFPLDLAGVRAEVDGRAIGLLYISPRQVNLHIPDWVTPGQHTIEIQGEGGRVFTGSINVVANAPVLLTFPGTNTAAGFYLSVGPIYAALWGSGVSVRIDAVTGQKTGTVKLALDSGAEYDATYSGPAPPPIGWWQFSFILPPNFFDAGPVSGRLRVCPDSGGCLEGNTVTLRRN